MLTLTNVSMSNIEELLLLEVEPWQRKYTLPVAKCLARSYVEPERLIPLAITDAENPIGFLQFRLYSDKNIILLETFLIDFHHQTKGHAVDALRQFTAYAENLDQYDRIYCRVNIGNPVGLRVLENAGFMRGAVDLEKRINEMVYIIR